MENSTIVMILVFFLITTVVACMIAFVVIPSMKTLSESKKEVNEITIADVVNDVNAVNRAGYDYDKNQDERIEKIEKSLHASESESSPLISSAAEVVGSAVGDLTDNISFNGLNGICLDAEKKNCLSYADIGGFVSDILNLSSETTPSIGNTSGNGTVTAPGTGTGN